MGTAAMAPTLQQIDRLLRHAAQAGLFSGAACIGSQMGRIVHHSAVGATHTPPPLRRLLPTARFDLGELTGSLATALGVLYLSGKGRIDLRMPLSRVLPWAAGTGLADVSVDTLLDHTSGLGGDVNLAGPLEAADARNDVGHGGGGWLAAERAMQARLVAQVAAPAPAQGARFWPYGALLLGWVVQSIVHERLDVWLRRQVWTPLGVAPSLAFLPYPRTEASARAGFAATLNCPLRRRTLAGEVADPTAHVLGGVAGHAGLFGDAHAVWTLGEALGATWRGRPSTLHAATLRRMWTRLRRAGPAAWALGWENMARGSSLGQGRWHPTSVGQVDVRAGCGYLIDPSRGNVCVLLTNARHMGPTASGAAWLDLCHSVFELLMTSPPP